MSLIINVESLVVACNHSLIKLLIPFITYVIGENHNCMVKVMVFHSIFGAIQKSERRSRPDKKKQTNE